MRKQQGATLIEVLVAVIIVVVGLLGLAGLQSRVSLMEVEAFQRAQAIVLVQDMVSRINANRRLAVNYATGETYGTGHAAMTCAGQTGVALDLCEWNNELQGASETSGGNNVGAMLGARGCIEMTNATMPRQFKVSVVWQGTVSTTAPGGTTCGSGAFTDDTLRRAITATIEIGCLLNNPANGLCISTF
jgi:type IV pilus assembly protein PilV